MVSRKLGQVDNGSGSYRGFLKAGETMSFVIVYYFYYSMVLL